MYSLNFTVLRSGVLRELFEQIMLAPNDFIGIIIGFMGAAEVIY